MVSSDKSVSLQKWGIPEDGLVSAEVTLLERLVWVPFKENWWPALLYQNYTELQDHLYSKLDVVMKAQFAAAIMRQLNDPKPIKIARLLGREVLEVVEVDDSQFAEFYWQLPKVLPMACRKSKYGNDTKLYLDFHRALDQVEEIIRDISQNSFNLVADGSKKTWLQRAEEALAVPGATSSIGRHNNVSNSNKNIITRKTELEQRKEVVDEEEYNFLFKALDGMMENCSNTYDCACNGDSSVVAESVVTNSVAPRQTKTMSAISKQRETRDSLRRVLAQQRLLRESGSVALSNTTVINDEARNPSDVGQSSLEMTPSTEVQPGISGEDTILWKLLNSHSEDRPFDHGKIPLGPSRSAHGPELNAFTQKKMFVQPVQRRFEPMEQPIDYREEQEVDDREAVMAAARAAAAAELDDSFWNYLTCRTGGDL